MQSLGGDGKDVPNASPTITSVGNGKEEVIRSLDKLPEENKERMFSVPLPFVNLFVNHSVPPLGVRCHLYLCLPETLVSVRECTP